MKYLGWIALILIIHGCKLFLINPEVTFIIRNESAKDLAILTYTKSMLTDSVYIKSGQEYKHRTKYREGGVDDVSPFGRQVDSLVVAFSDGRALIHYCSGDILFLTNNKPDCGFGKNLMNFYAGSAQVITKKDKTTKTIVLDNSDYDKAVWPAQYN